MDPFTDVFAAYLAQHITLDDIRAYLTEWVEYGAQASTLCRPSEFPSTLCNVAIDNAYALAYTLGLLVY